MSTSTTVAITLDQGCCRCKTKIQKILCCLQERCGFVFDKVVYEKDKVLISGPFNVIDLCCKLRCKAGCLANKMEIVPPPPQKKKKKTANKQPEPVRFLCPCPYPYLYPCPNPQPTCPSSCVTPLRPCQCQSCRPPPPCPPPAPPRPPPEPPCPPPAPPGPKPPQPCPPPVCNKCPTWTPCQCRGYPWVVCCEENPPPDGACAVM